MKKKLLVLLSLLSMVTVGAMGAVACDKGNENNNSTSESQSSSESESESPSESESESDSSSGDVTPATYTVKFVDEDGTELSSATYEEGATVTVPAAPAKEATAAYTYEFAGWDKEVTAATADVTYTATYTKTAVNYTITFMDGETVVGTATFNVETTEIDEPEVPTKAGYTSVWNDYDLTLLEDQTVTVFSMAIKYTITFVNGNDTVGSIIFTVEDNDKEAPAIAEKTGYTLNVGEYDLNKFENQTVEVTYTANTYAITYNANGGTVATETQYVTFDDIVTLAVPTPPATKTFLGWVDANGNAVESGKWTIADNVTLVATYSTFILDFEKETEVPSYLSKASQTESLSIVELNGNKVLKMQGSATGTNHGLNVTFDFLTQMFADETVAFLAFDVKSETTQHTNFRRSTIRTTGSVGSWGQEPYEADVQADNTQVMGYRADAFKTFFFSRKDYNNWVENNKTVEMLISAGNFAAGESLYVDNIRPVTQAQYNAANYGLETGGIRPNGGNLLVYYVNTGSAWQYAITADTVNDARPTFSSFGYTNENVTEGNRALVFTKTAGQVTMRFNNTDVANFKAIANATGYYSFDLYVSAESDAVLTYPNIANSAIPGHTPNKGGWMTIYCENTTNVGVKVADTTGGTYMLDNFRSVTADEYQAAQYGFEAGTGGLRTNLLNDENTNLGAFYWYNKGTDYSKVTASLSVGEGNGAGDVNAISNVRLDYTIKHSGNSSIAFDKGKGYVAMSRHANSQALTDFAGGFTFWIYSTTAIDGTSDSAFYNGVNARFNGGAGLMIPANTWTKVTVQPEDIGNGRFLILQGSWTGTIYLDDFQPLK